MFDLLMSSSVRKVFVSISFTWTTIIIIITKVLYTKGLLPSESQCLNPWECCVTQFSGLAFNLIHFDNYHPQAPSPAWIQVVECPPTSISTDELFCFMVFMDGNTTRFCGLGLLHFFVYNFLLSSWSGTMIPWHFALTLNTDFQLSQRPSHAFPSSRSIVSLHRQSFRLKTLARLVVTSLYI